jgi:alkanesulfonate monooxygenase SsuD/methylene tetrahydromethanopterin reductase-like flavin-dependent oxidoreductase (luciferase family)
MKFGIFYELQLPRPWQAGGELKLYQDALTQLETADRRGYDYAWVVEHHFLEEYSHSPSPESFLAAASQRTKNIRLGHGIFQLTTNHPARVAERVAVLDLLSNGRCEFGMGESASITELTPFGRDMETKKEVFEEAVRAIFPMFREGGSEHHGKYFDIPLRMWCPNQCRSRIRPCGWPVRSFPPSSARVSTVSARSAFSSSAPMRRMPGCMPITTPSPSG